MRVVAWARPHRPADRPRARRPGARRPASPDRGRDPADLILDETARYFGLSAQDLISPNRSRPLTNARHVAMYLIRESTGQSLVKIGELVRRTRPHDRPVTASTRSRRTCARRTATYRQVQDLSRIIRGRARARMRARASHVERTCGKTWGGRGHPSSATPAACRTFLHRASTCRTGPLRCGNQAVLPVSPAPTTTGLGRTNQEVFSEGGKSEVPV